MLQEADLGTPVAAEHPCDEGGGDGVVSHQVQQVGEVGIGVLDGGEAVEHIQGGAVSKCTPVEAYPYGQGITAIAPHGRQMVSRDCCRSC